MTASRTAPENTQANLSTAAYVASSTPAEHMALSCFDVEKRYGFRNNVTHALNNVSFNVATGEYVAIMGPSGSGKTTLLNCISTIDRATSGRILIDGHDICALKSHQLARFRREHLGFIFQDSNLLDTLTARENIALALTINHTPAGEVSQRVEAIAARLGIADVLDKFPHELSGGQQQRVAASRAIVSNPSLVLADEPTGALDSKNARLLLESLAMLNDDGATIIMVTHDAFAASYARRVLFLKDGRLFNEIVRGSKSRNAFFSEIMDVVSFLGGEGVDVH